MKTKDSLIVLLITAAITLVGNFVGYKINIIEAIPGVLILVAISIIGPVCATHCTCPRRGLGHLTCPCVTPVLVEDWAISPVPMARVPFDLSPWHTVPFNLSPWHAIGRCRRLLLL